MAYHRQKQSGTATLHRLRNQIASQNDKLAIMVARRYQQRCNLPLDDLKQLSRIGLLKAIPKFDPFKGVAFSSFVVPYCEGEIKHFLRDHRSLVKTPRRWQETSDRARQVQAVAAKNGRVVELDEIACLGLGLERNSWQAIENATQHRMMSSLEDEALQIADEPSKSLEELEQEECQRAAILKQMATLSPEVQECIIECYWGELSNDLIAKRHNLTVKQVEVLIQTGLEQLRGAAAVC